MNIVFFGTPEFAVLPLKKLLEAKHKVLAVVTQPDRQSGRGRHITSCPVKVVAQEAGLKILQPLKVKDPDFINQLITLNPEAIVVAAYGQILPPAIIHLPRYGCINIHSSLLPKYRGAAPINQALLDGETKTGITTMLMDEGMDTGPILLQEEMEIKEDDTAGSLSQRLSEAGSGLLMQTLNGLEDGSIQPLPQTGEATYAPILKKTDGLIDWTGSAEELCNFIRGLNPWPCAYTFLEDERIKILKASPCTNTGSPGIINMVSKNELIVGAGAGSISVLDIQPAGKPVMTIRAFLQGRNIMKGMRFESH